MNAERRVQIHLDRWIRLLGMTSWRITWEIAELPDDEAIVKYNDQEAHIQFDRASLTSDTRIEDTVGHELLHVLSVGARDHERFIRRLAPRMRMVRRRAARR